MPAAEPKTSGPASCERTAPDDLRRQIDSFADADLIRNLLDAMPTPLLLLNRHHQIVYANQSLLNMVSALHERQVHGMRPGEVLDCIVARESANGCGTAEACKSCGAVMATLSSQTGRCDERECCITRDVQGRLEALDLRVRTTPIEHAGEHYTAYTITDISHEKRRRVLERIFFHDILNVAGSIHGFAEFLLQHAPENQDEIYALIKTASEQAIEEIQTQRLLAAAENHELQIRPEPVYLPDFLQATVGIFRLHKVARERTLHLTPRIPEIILTSDRTLLGRMLGNTIKNALEACAPGEKVTVDCEDVGERVRISVHNPGVIAPRARTRIFQRSFSTKGEDRGLGTYSLRLLGNYLKSEVSFTSCREKGTTFHITHPMSLN